MTRVRTARKKETDRVWAKANKPRRNGQSKEWNKRNLEKRKVSKKAWNKAHPEWQTQNRKKKFVVAMWYATKRRAKESKLPFDLTKEWLEERLRPMTCEVTGVALEVVQKGKKFKHAWTPSVDQIKPGKGYTKRNSQIVCWCYNAAKQKWDKATVLKMAKGLLEL